MSVGPVGSTPSISPSPRPAAPAAPKAPVADVPTDKVTISRGAGGDADHDGDAR